MRRHMILHMILNALVVAGCLIKAGSAVADGAIATGVAPGGVIHGYAVGFGFNTPDEKSARDMALDGCKKSRGANDKSKSQCQVVSTYRNKCGASAIDPKDGTPGVGWGIGDTQAAADAEALTKCRSTAGPARQSFCVVTDRHCDGTAH
jgi:hypothetical protein